MGHLETTERFRNKLETTKRQLEEDFNDDAIKDMFEFNDQFWTNSLAEQLWETLNNLEKECLYVIKDCRARKVRLDNALIGWLPPGTVKR